MQPGRSRPLHYRYSPRDFPRPADFHADTLYVIGGLYGNLSALKAQLEMAAREAAPVTPMFKSDFNWLNIDDAAFRALKDEVLCLHPIRGNVKTEIAGKANGSGCGCIYPDDVSDEGVDRFNRIIARPRDSAQRDAPLRARLARLPMQFVAQVGRERVTIVHSDFESLAGWSLLQETLTRDDAKYIIYNQTLIPQCAILASSHTYLLVACVLDGAKRRRAVFNSGAAGLPRFFDTRYGVITRIATTRASNVVPLYATRIGALFADALLLRCNPVPWQHEGLAQWPPGSTPHLSYHRRMVSSPAYVLNAAHRLAVSNSGRTRPTVDA